MTAHSRTSHHRDQVTSCLSMKNALTFTSCGLISIGSRSCVVFPNRNAPAGTNTIPAGGTGLFKRCRHDVDKATASKTPAVTVMDHRICRIIRSPTRRIFEHHAQANGACQFVDLWTGRRMVFAPRGPGARRYRSERRAGWPRPTRERRIFGHEKGGHIGPPVRVQSRSSPIRLGVKYRSSSAPFSSNSGMLM